MARHRRRKPSTPTGMKVFVGLMAGIALTGTALLAGAQVKDPGQDKQPTIQITPAAEKTTSGPKPIPTGKASPTATASPAYPMYVDCQAAKEAGALPLKRGEPGYLAQFDQDNDGTACEGV